MVQDHHESTTTTTTASSSATSIPEELYNLTQLAEVTLAAGKLSTTNISEITEYINNEKIKQDEFDIIIEKPENLLNNNIKCKKFRRKFTIQENLYNTTMTTTTTSTINDKIIENSYINSNKNNIEKIENFLIIKPIPFNPINNNNQNQNHQQQQTKMKIHNENVNFFSSSDDDSNYYSHKIFDRKKSRRSTFSDNSTIRLDELSCSSFPSSCDELNYSASSNGGSNSNCGIGGVTNTINIDENSIKVIRENSNSSIDDEHICPECGKKYSTSSNLARHRQTHRSILDKKARRCPYCEKVYVSMPAYSMHVRTHNQGCKCDHCGKCFSRPWLLQGHIRTHTGEKPFKCSTCNKAFADKSNLRAHIQTHSNTKPHACVRCGKSFALKSYLYKHEESSCMRNHMKHEKDRTSSTSSSGSSTAISLKMTVTKSTLASKILQKESQALKDLHQLQNPITQQNNQLSTEQFPSEPISNSPKNLTWDYERRDYATTITTDIENDNNNNNEKSYTTLTSPMSQEEYDRFARISVIRPPISAANYIDNNHQHHQIQSQTTNSLQMNFYQENPVDFSPKNNFTHSTKTSPFELTGSYAMVA